MSLWAFWWRLPGPSSFLNRVVTELQDGSNLILKWPNYGPSGWREGLQAHDSGWCGDRGSCWFESDAINELEPERFLYEKIFRKEVSFSEINPKNLAGIESFLGRLIV